MTSGLKGEYCFLRLASESAFCAPIFPDFLGTLSAYRVTSQVTTTAHSISEYDNLDVWYLVLTTVKECVNKNERDAI